MLFKIHLQEEIILLQNGQQVHQNLQTGQVPQAMNHGGHEMFDVHEVLVGAINTMNLYKLLGNHIQDPELRDIQNRQYQFIQEEYNLTLECFQTGQPPAKRTEPYMMKENNDFIFGMTQMPPAKPIQNVTEMSDQAMLSALKASASMKTMAAAETTNPVVRRVIAASIPNCLEMAYEVSLYQNKHHYYQVPQLAAQDMQNILNGFAPAQGAPMMQQQMNMNNNMH
ncbi:spore coat protein [Niallia sp. FSL W8-0177]|uniref:spore coat protein n=1 Tax=Niallia sp. FSL W8-0177 TaxID=2954522 RepID=UPI004046B670